MRRDDVPVTYRAAVIIVVTAWLITLVGGITVAMGSDWRLAAVPAFGAVLLTLARLFRRNTADEQELNTEDNAEQQFNAGDDERLLLSGYDTGGSRDLAAEAEAEADADELAIGYRVAEQEQIEDDLIAAEHEGAHKFAPAELAAAESAQEIELARWLDVAETDAYWEEHSPTLSVWTSENRDVRGPDDGRQVPAKHRDAGDDLQDLIEQRETEAEAQEKADYAEALHGEQAIEADTQEQEQGTPQLRQLSKSQLNDLLSTAGGKHRYEGQNYEQALAEAAEAAGVSMTAVDVAREQRAKYTRLDNVDHARAAAFEAEANEAADAAMEGPPAPGTVPFGTYERRWAADERRAYKAHRSRLVELCETHNMTLGEHDAAYESLIETEIAAKKAERDRQAEAGTTPF